MPAPLKHPTGTYDPSRDPFEGKTDAQIIDMLLADIAVGTELLTDTQDKLEELNQISRRLEMDLLDARDQAVSAKDESEYRGMLLREVGQQRNAAFVALITLITFFFIFNIIF